MFKRVKFGLLLFCSTLLLFVGCFESPVGDDTKEQDGITVKGSTETYSYQELLDFIKEESNECNAIYEDVLDFVGTDFLKEEWTGSDCDIINKSVKDAIEKSKKYIAPTTLVTLVTTMAKDAGYPPKVVIEALGTDFFTKLWLKSEMPIVKKTISDTIAGLDKFISIKELKELIISLVNELPDSVAIDIEDILLLLDEDFLDKAWLKEQLPLIKKLIKEYIKDLINDDIDETELNPKVLKAIVVKMSEEASVDPEAVARVLGKEFFLKEWKKSDLPQIKKEVTEAIEIVKAETLSYDVVKSIVYQQSEDAGVDYQKVMDVLGAPFFNKTWLKRDYAIMEKVIAQAIEVVKNQGDYFTYDEVKLIVVEMSDSIGLLYTVVMDTLGKEFFEKQWLKSELPQLQQEVQAAIDLILDNNEFLTYDEIKLKIYDMSEVAGVNYMDVINVLTFDFLNRKWLKSQWVIVERRIAEAIKVVQNQGADTISYDELKAYIVLLSDSAGVDYMEVMDSLGEKFLSTQWKTTDWYYIESEVKTAIAKVIGDGDLIGYDSLKAVLVAMSDSAGVDYIEVMDSVGEAFMNAPWTTPEWPEIKMIINGAIQLVLDKDLYIKYDSLKAAVFAMSDSAGVDYIEVMDTLGKEFFAPKMWKKTDWSYVRLEINTAIDMVKTGNKILSYDEIKAIVVEMCDKEAVDYMLVMDVLGEEFFKKEWRISQVTWIQKETSGAIWEVKNG